MTADTPPFDMLPWVIEDSPCGVVALQPDGQIEFINQTMLDWLDLRRSDVQGKPRLADLFSRAISIYMQTRLLPQLMLTGAFQEVAITLQGARGVARKTLVAGRRVAATGNAVLVFSPSDDRARLDEDLARMRDVAQTRLTWLDQIERIADIGAWSIDMQSGTLTWSDQIFAIHDLMLGPSPPLADVLVLYPEIARQYTVYTAMQAAAATREPFQFEAALHTAQRIKRVRLRGQVQWEMGKPRRILGVIEDITDQSIATEKLWRAANCDDLSGLPNRRWFGERLAEAIAEAQRSGQAFSLLMMDLDHFKEVNDDLGHEAGDTVIRILAQRIRAALPHDAFVGRLGGDEFAAILWDDPAGDTRMAQVQGLLTALRRPITIGGTDIEPGATIGMARFPDDASTPRGVLRSADMALLHAKRTSKGSVVTYDIRFGAAAAERRSAINRVRQAAGTGRVIAHYQPRIDLATGRVCGFEALARIVEADGTCSGPSVWGAALQDPNCARLVDDQVLRAVIADYSRLGADSRIISLNRTEHSVRRGDFVTGFLKVLQDNDIPTTAIEIEVQETVLVDDAGSRLGDQLAHLRRAGVSVALGGFGTGYASLMHLTGLPIDRIKLDRSFMHGLEDKARNAAIVRAMVGLAHALGIKVVAEGVDSEVARDFLLSTGCDEAQGLLFGAPAAR